MFQNICIVPMENMSLKEVLERITDINIELLSMSYSQSDPGAMMNRRMLRKEREALERRVSYLTAKKKD